MFVVAVVVAAVDAVVATIVVAVVIATIDNYCATIRRLLLLLWQLLTIIVALGQLLGGWYQLLRSAKSLVLVKHVLPLWL